MSKYKFRLETLQKLRVARRDQQRGALAEAFQAEQVLAGHRAEIAGEQSALRELQRSTVAGRYLDVNRLLEAQRYDFVLKAREQELAQQAELLKAETERRRQAVVEADRDVRSLELLDERQRREHRRGEQRRESKQMDEAALNKHRLDFPA
jgi:flagellar export protein FliJ